MTKTKKISLKLLSFLLTLAMVLGLLPGMGLTALAWDGDPYAELLNTTTAVNFDGKEWYLIENNSTAVDAGTVTLLSKECVAASQYNSSGSYVEYASSTVKTAVDNWYNNNITSNAKTAVFDNKMFLLTKDQANAMTTDTRKCSQASEANYNYWWLCSPGSFGNFASCVYGGSGNVLAYGYSVVYALGVRPALKLDLSKVTFDSGTNTFSVGSAEPEPGVSYVDGSGTSQTVDATELAANTTSWTDGSWYIVPAGGVTISSRITVNGTVNLILRDGATLTASAGITTTGATLNIYAQSAGTGALTAKGSNGCAGIGGRGGDYGSSGGAGGTVSIFGGTVTATGGTAATGYGGGAGIGGGGSGLAAGNSTTGGAGGTVSIFGGTVTATGGAGNHSGAGAGIGGGGKDRRGSDGARGTLTLGAGVKLYNGTNKTGTVLDDSDSTERTYSGSRPQNMFAEFISAGSVDKTALNTAITAAETLYNSINGNDDYTDIANTLKTAIDNAKAVADSDEVDQDAIDAATTAITDAKTNAETAKKDVDDTKAANAVIDKINALPTTVTTANKADIEAARAAYDALTDAQKEKVGDAAKTKLEAAETAVVAAEFNEYKEAQKTAAESMVQTGDSDEAKDLIAKAKKAIDDITYVPTKTLDENKAAVTAVVTKLTTDLTDQRAADAVIEKINALPASTDITSDNKDDIKAARDAYDALTDAQKEKVGDAAKTKLEAAETALSEAQVNETTDKINDLPSPDKVTADNKDDIEAARAAYNALTSDQKEQVGDEAKEKLEAAEAALAIAELPAASDVTTTDKTAIEAARAKYDELTDAQKEQVGDAAQAKLEAVEAALLIAQLPEASSVTTADKTAIEKAREAYDALTDAQKAQVGDTLKEKLEAAEVALTKKLIEAIPDPADVTTADADKVAAAKTAYDKLTDDQKAKITEAEKEKLDAAAQALSDAETSDVEALIKALPSASSVTTANAEAIEAAKEAFDELTEAQKAIVKSTLKDKLAADVAALAIAKLPAADNVTAADKDAIEAAREAYDALTSTQKSSIGEAAKAKLEAAEAKIQDAVDTEAAQAVIDKINALPASTTVTADNKNAIEEARAAYDALTDNQKAKIDADTLKKLTDAEAAIQDVEDKAAADAVNATIDALPDADDVTVSDKAAIEAARAAYDALTDNQKAKIDADTLKKLTDAEDALALAESKDKLDKTISSATAYYDSIKNRYPTIAATLKKAIEAAQAVLDDEDVKKADIDAAVKALNTAVSTARTAVSYAGGGSSTPSYVPSYSPSNTSTTTTTTTTTTNTTVNISDYDISGAQDDANTSALKWDSIPNATKYSLYIKVDGKYVFVQDLGKSTVADVVLSTSGKYYVSTGKDYTIYKYNKDTKKFDKAGTLAASKIESIVKANNVTEDFMVKYTVNGKESAESNSYKVSVKIYYKPAIKLTAKKGSITIKWNKVPEATKYRVYKYVNGSLKLITATTKNAVRITGTKAGTKYSYAVKAYVDGKWTKVYTSDIVSVKAK